MLRIYTDEPSDNYVKSNDIEFSTRTMEFLKSGKLDNYKRIISEIEGVDFVNDNKFISKINGELLSLSELSTGCKTILNILCNPDKIISVAECGNNYSKFVYRLKDGSIYMPYVLSELDHSSYNSVKLELITSAGVKNIESIDELEGWYNGCSE